MLKKALLVIVAALVLTGLVLCLVVAMQPDEYSVTRSAMFNAPPEKVFEQVNDFHKWDAWSPWAKLDPAMKTTHSGAASGTGAEYAWTGNDEVGKGKMTILESRPSDLIKIELEFQEPFAAKSLTEFTFKPEGGKTNVVWSMKGENSFISKAFHLIMDMDKMIGIDFEKGLAQMRSIVETAN